MGKMTVFAANTLSDNLWSDLFLHGAIYVLLITILGRHFIKCVLQLLPNQKCSISPWNEEIWNSLDGLFKYSNAFITQFCQTMPINTRRVVYIWMYGIELVQNQLVEWPKQND